MIYFIQDQGNTHIKVGFTDGEALSRLRKLQTGNSAGLVLLGTLDGTKADEGELHRRFAAAKVAGEWFRPAPELLLFIIGEMTREASLPGRAEQLPAAAPLFLSEPRGHGECVVICPRCGMECSHMRECHYVKAASQLEAVRVRIEGECGHVWDLVISQHEGNNWLGTTGLIDPDEPFPSVYGSPVASEG